MKPSILIVVPRYTSLNRQSYYEFPLGLAYISACLKQAGFSMDVINLNAGVNDCYKRLDQRVRHGGYAYVLTGGLSAHYQQIRKIVDVVRQADQTPKIVVGGGIVTASPQLMFDYLNPDLIVMGEGEVTTVELIRFLESGSKEDPAHIQGIGYRSKDGEIKITPPRPAIRDLDALPFPDLEGFEVETYLDLQQPNDNLYLYIDDDPRVYPIISSRGCPYHCTFCYHPLGQKYRSRSIDNFIAEVEYVTQRYGVNNLAIFDELISANRQRFFELCIRLKQLKRPVHWMCQIRVDLVDEEMLRVMKEAGCYLVSYGFESANDAVLKSMKKFITKDQIERALLLTRQAGISIQGYFIFGDPAETAESAAETLSFWKKHRDFHITLGYIRPYPGSELWDRELEKSGLESIDFLEKCTYDPPNMSRMNQPEWFDLQKNVQRALMENDHFGKVISGRKTDDRGHEITILCPHCQGTTQYRNFNQRILGTFNLRCRKCNQAMNLSPLAFENVRQDFARNQRAYRLLKTEASPVTVIPCMNEAEFEAQRELLLQELDIKCFLDADPRKQARPYQGCPVYAPTLESIRDHCDGHFFVIPLTRFADKLFDDLVSMGVPEERICRLDTLFVGPDWGVTKDLLQEAGGLDG